MSPVPDLDDLPPWLPVAQTAGLLGVKRQALYQRIDRGTCPLRVHDKYGRMMFRTADVVRYLAELRDAA